MEMKDGAVARWEDLKGKVASMCMEEKNLEILESLLLAQGQIDGLEFAVSEVKHEITNILISDNVSAVIFLHSLLDVCRDRHVSDILCALMLDNQRFLDICLLSEGSLGVLYLLIRLGKSEPCERDRVRAVVRSAMVPILWPLVKTDCGHQLIVECLILFKGVKDVIEPILEEIANHVVDIATNRTGWHIVLECCFLADSEGLAQRQRLLGLVISNAYHLSLHQYGFLIVYHVIEIRSSEVIKTLQGSFGILSRDNYGSDVVKNCSKYGSDENVKLIIMELIDNSSFAQILRHHIGVYVVETALRRSMEMSESSVYRTLMCRIQSYHTFLHKHPHPMAMRRLLSHSNSKFKPDEI